MGDFFELCYDYIRGMGKVEMEECMFAYFKKVLENDVIEYKNIFGELHRDDGPAIIWSNGNQYWFKNGKIHREDGPAVIYSDGYQSWYKNGLRHRNDGPAIIYSSGEIYWYLNHTPYTFKEWCELMNISDEEKMELALIYG